MFRTKYIASALVKRAHARSTAQLSASLMKKTVGDGPGLPPLNTLRFGAQFSPHMLEVDWTMEHGWESPSIHPRENLSLDPASLVFHYGIECFEGMKAYRGVDGKTRLFRPMLNMERLERSSTRLGLPTFDTTEMLECIKELVRTDADYVPPEKGYSLYLRPTMIGTTAELGVRRPDHAKCFVISSPVGPYYPTGYKPVSLIASEPLVRAWPGGMGAFKVGGNYAPGILPAINANAQGHQQVLWMFEGKLSEVGVMNLFVFWRNEDGEDELITPTLDGTVLPGVTRQSILDLGRAKGAYKVTEGDIHIQQLVRAKEEGRLHEVFGAGTACVVCPVHNIHFDGMDYPIPLGTSPNSTIGDIAEQMSADILAIQFGEVEHEWAVLVD